MEGWEGNRVVSSLIWMPSEHSEVMVWLLVGVRAHGNAYGDVDIMFIREGFTYMYHLIRNYRGLLLKPRNGACYLAAVLLSAEMEV